MPTILPLTLNNEDFVLHPSGALFWKTKNKLLIADVHLGKVVHFRKHGSAVPMGIIAQNFDKLTEVVTFFNPKEVCFLGDLFHSTINNEWQFFEAWVLEYPKINFELVIGNHDIIDFSKFYNLGISTYNELIIDTILLTHEPKERISFFNICGHIHPGVQLQGNGKQLLKLSCFYKKENQLILPAFGGFTGKYILELEAAVSVFAIAEDEVILLK